MIEMIDKSKQQASKRGSRQGDVVIQEIPHESLQSKLKKEPSDLCGVQREQPGNDKMKKSSIDGAVKECSSSNRWGLHETGMVGSETAERVALKSQPTTLTVDDKLANASSRSHVAGPKSLDDWDLIDWDDELTRCVSLPRVPL